MKLKSPKSREGLSSCSIKSSSSLSSICSCGGMYSEQEMFCAMLLSRRLTVDQFLVIY